MKRHSHNSVSQIKCLLHAVPVMHVNVNVQHPGVVLEQFQNCNDNVIDVAKSRGLEFLRVMQSTAPIDGNVAAIVV